TRKFIGIVICQPGPYRRKITSERAGGIAVDRLAVPCLKFHWLASAIFCTVSVPSAEQNGNADNEKRLGFQPPIFAASPGTVDVKPSTFRVKIKLPPGTPSPDGNCNGSPSRAIVPPKKVTKAPEEPDPCTAMT